MTGMDSHIEMAIGSVKCFTDDGKLDVGELNYLLGLAMRDGVIDDDEKRVLSNIFKQVAKDQVNDPVWARILEVKKKHDIA